jgi:YVTN family beta-propeller protein
MPSLRLPATLVVAASVACAPAAKSPASSESKTAALEASGPAPAAPTPGAALLVLSKRERTLAIVDPSTLKIVAKVPVGDDPHEVIASADGKTAYVSNYGRGAFKTLAVVDLVHQRALPSIDLDTLRGPHGLAFAGGKVWFTAEASKVIGRYDPASSKVDWVMGTGQNRTHMIYVAKDQKWIATSNVESATVTILDNTPADPGPPPPAQPVGAAAASAPTVTPPGAPPSPAPHGPPGGDWNETVIAVGGGSEGFDVSPDGSELWVANARDGTVSVIDLATRKVTQTLQANVLGANRLKFSPNGHLVFISTIRGADLTVLDTTTRKETKRVKLGHGATGILMQPNGERVFVACSPDNDVAVIDMKTLEVAGRIDVGQEPDGMAWAVRP